MKKIFTLLFMAAMALGAYAETATVTVCEGTDDNSTVPFYGLYFDTEGTLSQMIYPAELLSEVRGGQITKLKFFAKSGFKHGENGNLQLSLLSVEQASFLADAPEVIEGAAVVGNGTPAPGETELVFTLDAPFEYVDGNLLVETVVTATASFSSSYFFGTNTDEMTSLYKYNWAAWADPSVKATAFLPKMEIEYTKEATAVNHVNAGKAVTDVRYYNLNGQQVSQPTGATIVVTTYSDGTTSLAKVLKVGSAN